MQPPLVEPPQTKPPLKARHPVSVWRSCPPCAVEWRDPVPTCWSCGEIGVTALLATVDRSVGALTGGLPETTRPAVHGAALAG